MRFHGLAVVKSRDTIVSSFYSEKFPGSFVRRVRGSEMHDANACVSEFISSCQFWEDAGHNFAALNEMLCYIDEFYSADSYSIIITDAEQLLITSDADFSAFLDLICYVTEWWASPITDNPPYNRDSKMFRFIFEVIDPEIFVNQPKVLCSKAKIGVEWDCLAF